MADESGKIMLAFDFGDAGFVPLTIEQAQQVIDSLQTVMKQLKLIPAPGPEDHPPIGKKETDGLN